ILESVGESQRCNDGGRHSFFWVNARMSRLANDLRFPPFRAGGANRQLSRRAAIDVKAVHRIPQVSRIDIASTPQTALFPHGEEKRHGWVRQSMLQESCYQGDQAGNACSIVTAEGSFARGNDAIAFLDRFGARAQGNRVEVSHE